MADPEPPLPHPYPDSARPAHVPSVSVSELTAVLRSASAPVLLDVRSLAERMPHDGLPVLWVPLAELPRRIREVPADRPVVVVDRMGLHAPRAVELLSRAGFRQVSYLDGGLDAYSRLVDPTLPRYVEAPGSGGVFLYQLPRPETGCLSYLLRDAASSDAVIIDPGPEPEPYVRILHRAGLSLRAIVETHTHADHLAGHAPLNHRTGAPIVLGAKSPAQYPHRRVADGESVDFGGSALRVLETPGHTRDHVSLVVAGKVFTGDTLLLGSCGRTDLGDGDPRKLWTSLTEKLLALPESTEVLPAHFGAHHALPEPYSSTIGIERATNEALTVPDEAAFLRYMTEGWPPKPAEFDRIVRANLAAFD